MNPQQQPQAMMPNQPMQGQPGQLVGQPMQGVEQPVGAQVAMPGQPMQSVEQPVGAQVAMPGQPMQSVEQPVGAQVAMPGQPMQPVGQPMQGGQMPPQQMPPQQIPQNSQMTQNPNVASIGSTAMQAQQIAPKAANKDVPTSTQATLLISELRDNVVIMKDGSFRAVVACKSINFDLMSEVEREAVEYSYQNFLNSLKFTTQFLIRSQRVDIGPYLEKLAEIRRNNDNMLLGVLMDDYINFVDILSQEANIMDKSFFIIVPYYPSADVEKTLQQTKNFFKSFSKSKGIDVTRIDRATYDKAMTEINNRVDTVTSGLFQIGIQSVRLNTKELAELYYNFNNPDTAVREPLVDFSKLATLYVKKGEKPTNGTVNMNGGQING